MNTLDKQITARKLRNRYYEKPTVDAIQDAAVISEKVRSNNGCATALGVGLVCVILLAGLAVFG